MTPIHYIFGALLSFALIYTGCGGEGYLHKAALIIGGIYLGFLITEALNYDETKNVTTDNTTKG